MQKCPPNSFLYNQTLCACNPGYYYTTTCTLFSPSPPSLHVSTGISSETSLSFPETLISFDSIKKLTQSQAVFLEATFVMLITWLGFCFVLRMMPMGVDGRSKLFRIRWWISRMDVSFATRHWLLDQKVVVKRKTELGGAFSVAGWILFIGLFAALLYQIISKRSVEVHNVRATNAPDLATFLNDMEFNITFISSMSCAQLRGLGTLVTGNPSFIDYRVLPLSSFANYSCVNTTSGPTITLQCNSCQFISDVGYISWQFVDLPNNPATAVGFQFNLTAKGHAQRKHLSSVSGVLKNASNSDSRPITFRGPVSNILKFNLFPRIYHNLRDLKLIQPLFHEFLPGSFFDEVSQLQASLNSSNNGLINTTLYINFLSSYIVEIDNQNILGPVSFLADLGGLYCISIGIFFYLLVQCEYRIKRLRNEDSVMRSIRNRRKAQDRWEKLRKYVRFTWGTCSVDDIYGSESKDPGCSGVIMKSFHKSGSSHRRRPHKSIVAVSFNKKTTSPCEKEAVTEHVHNQEVKEDVICENLEHDKDESTVCSQLGVADLPQLPPFELENTNEMSMSEVQKKLEKLYEYNVMLREKLIHVLEEKARQ